MADFKFPEEARNPLWDNFRKKQEGEDSGPPALHHRVYAAITGFFTEIWERLVIFCNATYVCVSGLLILFFNFLFGLLFIIPLTPAFTLHSISTSSASSSIHILNTTATAAGENPFTTNFGIQLHVDHSNPIGSSIGYGDSLHASLFHCQENISTFFLPRQQELKQSATTAIEALFPNVSLMVDEWTSIMDHGPSSLCGCGYVYLDLWFNASARFTPFLNVKDKLQGHCGEVKVQLCSSPSSSSVSAATTVVHPFHASCDVDSDVVSKIRLVLLVMLIFLVGTVVLIHLLIGHFLCRSRFTHSSC